VQNVEYIDFDQCASYKPPRGLRARHRELAPRSVGNDYKREETSETA
jgi:thiamine biosynthesis protein ThiI